ncbi:hypothetical protein F383_30692 [Gossypium arboreum]|uniref:Uncharacterized protein n=1 Tax=Gossypium arboreum TaxID=29729 RepID=A0A0B0PHZ4_GOSAR|nr:hypothetical protein F383_30692 [Gossypium arboreum]
MLHCNFRKIRFAIFSLLHCNFREIRLGDLNLLYCQYMEIRFAILDAPQLLREIDLQSSVCFLATSGK